MDLVLLIGAIAISLLIFTFLLRVAKAAIGTAFLIALIFFGVQILLGVGPDELWQQTLRLWENIWRSLFGGA